MIEHDFPTNPPGAQRGGEEPDHVASILRDAYAEHRLTLGDYTERVRAATGAGTPDDLARATAGLPETPVVGDDAVRRTVAIMGGSSRRGPWRPGRRTSALAIMGGCHLDLRGAYVDGDVLEVKATAIMGGISIVVPEGVDVSLSGFALMGGKSSRIRRTPLVPGTPRINVRARVLMGGVSIVNKAPRNLRAAGRRRHR